MTRPAKRDQAIPRVIMKEGAEKKGGWKGLPFYTRVTIAGLVVFTMTYTALNILVMIGGGVEVTEDAVQGIVFYALFMVPTLVIVVLTWRRPRELRLLAPLWAMLMLLITAPSIPNALSTFNSFFDAGLLIPAIVSLIVAAVAGIVAFLHDRRGAPLATCPRQACGGFSARQRLWWSGSWSPRAHSTSLALNR